MTTVFLFAHQDDEIGVFHEITDTVARNERAVCVYLTNGAWAGVQPEQRNAESSAVLRRLGVMAEDIKFVGTRLSIPDGSLVECLDQCLESILAEVQALGDVTRVIVPAWEGGHHDHDAAHLIALAVANHVGLIETSWQYPFYRAPAIRFFLSLAAPLEANGPVTVRPMGWRERIGYLAMLRRYRSQWPVMLRLGPLLAWSYLTNGTQKLQKLNVQRAFEIPMAQPLLYETWDLYSYERFRTYAEPFVALYLANGINPQANEPIRQLRVAELPKTN